MLYYHFRVAYVIIGKTRLLYECVKISTDDEGNGTIIINKLTKNLLKVIFLFQDFLYKKL